MAPSAVEVLLDLIAEVVHIVEQDPVEPPDPGVEVAGHGDVQDQGQPVPPRPALEAGITVKGDDRVGGGGGADDQVGLDQGVVEALERDGRPGPAGGGGPGSIRVPVGDPDPPGLEFREVLERQVRHLARADDQDRLVAEAVEDRAGDLHRDARHREPTLAEPGLIADQLADPQGMLEQGVPDRSDRPDRHRGLVGVADLSEDLALAEHQALQAGSDPEQVADDHLIDMGHQVPGERLGRDPAGRRQPGRKRLDARKPGKMPRGGVDLDPVAG